MGLALEESTANPEDQIYEVDGIRFVASANAAAYLKEATVEYHQGLLGKGFRIRGAGTSTC
ncbi:MAG: hypothetical protein GX977_07500 [Firmicutes bacterium]|nr:hypothetical protein [Bacillota bacterium]